MKFVFASFAVASCLVASAVAQGLTINTPTNVVECEPILITWSGGTPPYFLSVLPGNQPSAAALVTFPTTNATSVTWLVNQPPNTSLGLTLRDNTGTTAQSAPFTVNGGSVTSCIGQSASISAGSTGAASPATTTGAGATTAPANPTTNPTNPTTTGGAATTPTTPATTASGSASSPSSKSGASNLAAHFGAAGLVGAAVMAIMG